MTMESAHDTVERVVRDSYGRLLSYRASRSRNITAAEDALSEALLSALRHWPTTGIPANPDAWMLTAARNAIRNAWRHQSVVDAALPDLNLLKPLETRDVTDISGIPDERLKLMFVCAHPAIDRAIRAPLILQTILGLDAARIGGAFLVPATTMGQRLVRAKTKIRDAGLRFELPDKEDMPARLTDVLDAIYAAYGVGWDGVAGTETDGRGLTAEATYLARIVVSLLPGEPEGLGLLALILYCEARRAARRDGDGRFVPLDRQDVRAWNRAMIIEAEGLLTQASRSARFGRFQCEAAIQSVHVQRAVTGRTNHEALIKLYTLLVEQTQSVGARIALAAVYIDVHKPTEALAMLDSLNAADVQAYQPFWVIRARVLNALGDHLNADAAIGRALSLTDDLAVRAFLEEGRSPVRRSR
jgi:RNA polymerase sigma-70 factor (ECF subfamily)